MPENPEPHKFSTGPEAYKKGIMSLQQALEFMQLEIDMTKKLVQAHEALLVEKGIKPKPKTWTEVMEEARAKKEPQNG